MSSRLLDISASWEGQQWGQRGGTGNSPRETKEADAVEMYEIAKGRISDENISGTEPGSGMLAAERAKLNLKGLRAQPSFLCRASGA